MSARKYINKIICVMLVIFILSSSFVFATMSGEEAGFLFARDAGDKCMEEVEKLFSTDSESVEKIYKGMKDGTQKDKAYKLYSQAKIIKSKLEYVSKHVQDISEDTKNNVNFNNNIDSLTGKDGELNKLHDIIADLWQERGSTELGRIITLSEKLEKQYDLALGCYKGAVSNRENYINNYSGRSE